MPPPSLFATYFIVALAGGRREKEESTRIRLSQNLLLAIRKVRRPGDWQGKLMEGMPPYFAQEGAVPPGPKCRPDRKRNL
ncbi:MAG: hypothetical protein FJ117_07725 [Deltaproteobacteria bacterium]|nr:hypothetical protein [Deltaproteobacteria bacterium]